jgi:mannose-6-phosphate isomerase class I
MTPPKNWQGPLRLQPQFTPQSRTPWGGTRIAERYGKELGLPAGERVGEAWVLSLDQQFPTHVGSELLSELVDATLLVKLWDAAEPLSVQIHATLGPACFWASEKALARRRCGRRWKATPTYPR